jgi:hypothetical protein
LLISLAEAVCPKSPEKKLADANKGTANREKAPTVKRPKNKDFFALPEECTGEGSV